MSHKDVNINLTKYSNDRKDISSKPITKSTPVTAEPMTAYKPVIQKFSLEKENCVSKDRPTEKKKPPSTVLKTLPSNSITTQPLKYPNKDSFHSGLLSTQTCTFKSVKDPAHRTTNLSQLSMKEVEGCWNNNKTQRGHSDVPVTINQVEKNRLLQEIEQLKQEDQSKEDRILVLRNHITDLENRFKKQEEECLRYYKQCRTYEKKLEDMGVDPVSLEELPSHHQEQISSIWEKSIHLEDLIQESNNTLIKIINNLQQENEPIN